MTERVPSHAEVVAAALASLSAMSPARLRQALSEREPEGVWSDITVGRANIRQLFSHEKFRQLQYEVHRFDIEATRAQLIAYSIRVITCISDDFPAALREDDDKPPVLFLRGDISILQHRMVAIVGTRRATASGRATATELAEQLAAAGIVVVSGLALGVDTAAHRGAMRCGSTAAVVGCGLDRCYPARHQSVFDEISERHLVISEWPPGTPPAPFRFPMRNRLISAFSEIVVVVESGDTGGSLITAREALERGRTVMAVPGSPRVPTSSGTNALIRDGAAPVTSVGDVFDELGLSTSRQPVPQSTHRVQGMAVEIVHELSQESLTLNQLVERMSTTIGEVVVVVSELLRHQIITESNGWFELSRSMLVSGKECQ